MFEFCSYYRIFQYSIYCFVTFSNFCLVQVCNGKPKTGASKNGRDTMVTIRMLSNELS